MPDPIVHIGYPKNASTWLQTKFFPKLTQFEFVSRDAIREALLEPWALEFDVEQAARILGVVGPKPLLLSEEGLATNRANGLLSDAAARRLKAVLPNARILVLVRSQPSMLASLYQQYLKGGGTYSLRKFMFGDLYLQGLSALRHRTQRFMFEYLEYDRLIALYQSLFGEENVHVLLYEQFKQNPQIFLDTLLQRLGIDANYDANGLTSNPVNSGYGKRLLPLARFANLFTDRKLPDKSVLFHIPGWYDRRARWLRSINRTGFFGQSVTADQLFDPVTKRWLEDFYGSSNRRLAAMCRLPLSDYDWPMDEAERTQLATGLKIIEMVSPLASISRLINSRFSEPI